MTDFEIAIERLTCWIRDFGDKKQPVFISDLSFVLLAAKDSVRLVKRVEVLEAALKEASKDVALTAASRSYINAALENTQR